MQALNPDTRQWMAGEWLSGAALAPLAELNTQCLELLADMWRRGQGTPGQQALGSQIAALTPEARAGLAHAPYLFADAGFDDALRWQGLARWRVQDLPRGAELPSFTGPGAAGFVRGVFVYGWHLARAHRQLARTGSTSTVITSRTCGRARRNGARSTPAMKRPRAPASASRDACAAARCFAASSRCVDGSVFRTL